MTTRQVGAYKSMLVGTAFITFLTFCTWLTVVSPILRDFSCEFLQRLPIRADNLTIRPLSNELAFLALLLSASALGVATAARPVLAVSISTMILFGTAMLSFVLIIHAHVCFPWGIVAFVQCPGAWACVLFRSLRQTRARERQTRAYERVETKITVALPKIPDIELLRSVGRGAYGNVWLARNAVGVYVAVKIINRNAFADEGPYDREFRGITKFWPISLGHPNIVRIFHVGRSERRDYFFYIMEAADDVRRGREIDATDYEPKNLSQELARRGQLPVLECIELGIGLGEALEYLHSNQLIHRDIKPANVIYVNGVPKLADIGLVTDIRSSAEGVTYVGTPGYIPPEGPGTAQGDIYSLGILLYQAATGLSVEQFPELPLTFVENTEHAYFVALNDVIVRACANDRNARFQTASELLTPLRAVRRTLDADATSLSPVGEKQHHVEEQTRPKITPNPESVDRLSPESGSLSMLGKSLKGKRRARLAIIYRQQLKPDHDLMLIIQKHFASTGHYVFVDTDLPIGTIRSEAIEREVKRSDAAVILLSGQSVQSKLLLRHTALACKLSNVGGGVPKLLPVRVNLTSEIPENVAGLLREIQYFVWSGEKDTDQLLKQITIALSTARRARRPNTVTNPNAEKPTMLEKAEIVTLIEERIDSLRKQSGPTGFFAQEKFPDTKFFPDNSIRYKKIQETLQFYRDQLSADYENLMKQVQTTYWLWVACIILAFLLLFAGIIALFFRHLSVGIASTTGTILAGFIQRIFHRKEDHYRTLAKNKNDHLEYGNQWLLVIQSIDAIEERQERVKRQSRLVDALTDKLKKGLPK